MTTLKEEYSEVPWEREVDARRVTEADWSCLGQSVLNYPLHEEDHASPLRD